MPPGREKEEFLSITMNAHMGRKGHMPYITDELTGALKKLPLYGLDEQAQLLFLSHYTRHARKPVSVLIKGQSSSGKSHTMATVSRFFDPNDFIFFSGMSEKAFINSDIDYHNRTLMFGEYSGVKSSEGDTFLRQAMTDHSVSRLVSSKNSDGNYIAIKQEINAKFNIFMTTTEQSIHPEDENRFLSFAIPNDPGYIQGVNEIQADYLNGEITEEVDFDYWHKKSEWFKNNIKPVKINYMKDIIATCSNQNQSRLTRDIQKIFSLIEVLAIFSQEEKEKDRKGNILSDFGDYREIYNIINKCCESSHRYTSPLIKELSEFVRYMNVENERMPSNYDVQGYFNWSKSRTSRNCKKAVDLGYILNHSIPGEENQFEYVEERKDKNSFLPTPSEVIKHMHTSEAAWS